MPFLEKDIQKVFATEMFSDANRELALSIFEECGAQAIDFESGEIIHSPECAERRVGLILSGSASVTTNDASKETLLRFLKSGDFFGIANLFQGSAFVSVIRAQKKCRVFFWSEETIRTLLEQDKAFLYRYLEFLSGRICFLNQKIRYLTAGSVERKLALYLSAKKDTVIELDASLSSLSELLDVGRASLYRAFDRLIEDGYVQKDGRTITLLHPEDMLKAYQ